MRWQHSQKSFFFFLGGGGGPGGDPSALIKMNDTVAMANLASVWGNPCCYSIMSSGKLWSVQNLVMPDKSRRFESVTIE